MADTRYETLKKAVMELLEAQGNTNTLETVKDITSMMDKMEVVPEKPVQKESEDMAQDEFSKLGYLDRLALKQHDPTAYEKMAKKEAGFNREELA